jgi:hypothetical protein
MERRSKNHGYPSGALSPLHKGQRAVLDQAGLDREVAERS